jgi:hypothetical protein
VIYNTLHNDYLVILKGMMGGQDQSQRAWWSNTLNVVSAFVLGVDALIVRTFTVPSYAVAGISLLVMLVAIYLSRKGAQANKPAKAPNLALGRPPQQQSQEDQQLEFEFPQAPLVSDDGRISRVRPDISSQDIRLRAPIGIIGTALPFLLRIGILFRGGGVPYSLSGYYYSPLRNVLVVPLCILGFLLILYKGYNNLDRYVTTIAGIGFFGIALFPSNAFHSRVPSWVYSVHTFSFTCTIIALVIMALLFTRTESSDGQQNDIRQLLLALVFKYPGHYTPRKKTRNQIYSTCAWLMLVSLILAYWSNFWSPSILDITQWLFWLEAIAMTAFGTSWLVKSKSLPFFKDT